MQLIASLALHKAFPAILSTWKAQPPRECTLATVHRNTAAATKLAAMKRM